MRRLSPFLLTLSLAGCLQEPPYRCQTDEVCVLSGFTGICDLQSSMCVYPSNDCRGNLSSNGWVDGNGNCVPEPANALSSTTDGTTTDDDPTAGPTTSPTTDASTSVASTSSTTGTPAEAESTSGQPAEDSSSTGTAESTGEGCSSAQDITALGTATASSVFGGDDFPPHLSIDGAINTSWFSSGPEGGNGPSVYDWTIVTERCIERIEVDDNSGHNDPDFRQGFGFDAVAVRVLHGGAIVFEESISLPGTPDGPFTVDTGGVQGSRVLLEFSGHENQSCGGFSELRVFGEGS